jgi:fructokinase
MVQFEKTSVVVLGDALIDEIRTPESVEEFVGGAALNVAVGLSTLGIPTTLIAMVGDDEAGARIRSFLDEHGVTLIATVGPNGTSRAVSERINGEPHYEFNKAAQERRIKFGAEERAALSEASLVVVSCFPFDDVAQAEELLGAVDRPEERLVIDPNPRSGMLHDRDSFRDTFDRLAAHTLLVKVGDDDAALLYGNTVAELSDHLLASGSGTVLSTAGKAGASIATESGVSAHAPIADLPGPIVDTMGGGDATLASVIQSLLESGTPSDADGWRAVLDRAMLIAAATCRHEGALLRVP